MSRIGFADLELRYIAPMEQTDDAELRSEDTWVAAVQVTWRFRRYDAATSTLEVPMIVQDDGTTARFSGLSTPAKGQRVPLWLLERLAVRKGDRTLVLAADRGKLARLGRLADTAVPAVDKVLPDWKGSLVLEEPSSQELLDVAVGSERSGTNQLAGVTTTVDGSVERGGASHVLLNPDVFDGLGPQAAQIVVTHEATHVATDGAVSLMPTWLVEGFADYVALRDSTLPVSVSASQILGEVRKHGPPAELPASADFSGQSTVLVRRTSRPGWPARLIADTYGEDRLVAFYRRADELGGTRRAFAKVLGTSESAFTRSWSSYLRRLASGA